MSLVKNASNYEVTTPKLPTKSGIRVISEMSTSRILGYVVLRHRVGLLTLSTVFMAGYIVYDKVVKIFI